MWLTFYCSLNLWRLFDTNIHTCIGTFCTQVCCNRCWKVLHPFAQLKVSVGFVNYTITPCLAIYTAFKGKAKSSFVKHEKSQSAVEIQYYVGTFMIQRMVCDNLTICQLRLLETRGGNMSQRNLWSGKNAPVLTTEKYTRIWNK